jgi:uncharacterized protein YlxP (DUF503 family)
MVVGLLHVTMHLPENGSLKGKRKVIKSLLGRLRARFNVAAAEVASNDLWQRAELGVAVVGNDGRFVNSSLDTILDYMEKDPDAQVVDSRIEILNAFSEEER